MFAIFCLSFIADLLLALKIFCYFFLRPEEKEIEIQEEGEEESDVDEQYETLQTEEIEYLKKLSEGEFLKGIDRE